MHIKIFVGALILLTSGAAAQEHSTHAGGGAPVDLPAICLTDMPEGVAMDMSMPVSGDAAHQDLMDGMNAMNTGMMAGGAAPDIDVAFICSMLAHHRGAIDMAQAELTHGDDPWAKDLATAIIAAQEKEIAEMMSWLEQQK